MWNLAGSFFGTSSPFRERNEETTAQGIPCFLGYAVSPGSGALPPRGIRIQTTHSRPSIYNTRSRSPDASGYPSAKHRASSILRKSSDLPVQFAASNTNAWFTLTFPVVYSVYPKIRLMRSKARLRCYRLYG
ncbi:hypothetical protein PTI98_003676 [Pleurotus ostreatus]|nr:hypothetical protein PTI98_003676 [Pleurotus ostreatus]